MLGDVVLPCGCGNSSFVVCLVWLCFGCWMRVVIART